MENKSISKYSLQASIIIFFFYAATGAIFPIFNLLFRAKNFSMSEISYLLLIPNLFILLASPLWAAIADSFNIHKRILTLAMFLTIPFIVSLNFVNDFLVSIIFFSLFAFNFAPLMSMTDNAVLGLLGSNQIYFGRIRVWGSVAFGVSAWLVGFLSDKYSVSVAYWVSAICMLITVLATWKLPEQPAIEVVPFASSIKMFIHDNYWVGFLAVALVAGFGQSIIMNYFPAYMKDLGASSAMIGLSINISTLSEIPIMLSSPFLFKKISIKTLFQISLIALLVRILGYFFFTNVSALIIFQSLHGLTSSLFWLAAVIYARKIAPNNLNTTAIALLGATYYGLAGILGAYGGGQIYAIHGPHLMFGIGAFISIVGLIIIGKKINSN